MLFNMFSCVSESSLTFITSKLKLHSVFDKVHRFRLFHKAKVIIPARGQKWCRVCVCLIIINVTDRLSGQAEMEEEDFKEVHSL